MADQPADEPPGLSGLRLLHDAKEAFAARLILIQSARHRLDVQYYIWHNDLSGSLILDEIAAAASRGVAVRLLLDDNGINGLDAALAVLNQHANVAVRLFNPFAIRRWRALNWLLAYRRYNSRMHAKSLTADGNMTIVGGRNIGDEYFGARAKSQFDDLDVLASGPIVSRVEQVFEEHWRSRKSRPIECVIGAVSRRTRRKAARRAAALAESPAAKDYRNAIEALPLSAELRAGRNCFLRAMATVVSAMPRQSDADTKANGLSDLLPKGLEEPESELIIISGYFVPTKAGCNELIDLQRRGTNVRVLTNSFAATDVGVVHAGYAPCRRLLLEGGLELFEMPAPDDAPKRSRKFVRAGSARSRRHSGKSLHAKVYIVDRKQVYIGSANFDPRSAYINIELGILIDSPAVAGHLAAEFDQSSRNSYRLGLGSAGELMWTDERDDQPQPERTEPATHWGNRLLIRMLSKFPIQRQL